MKLPLVNRDTAFYPLVFGLWALLMIALHGNHSYFGSPFPGVDVRQDTQEYYHPASSAPDIGKLLQSLAGERNPKERARTLEAIGIGYFDRYRATHAPGCLDSAQMFVEEATRISATVPSYFFSLARILTEKKDFPSAKANYEKTVALDPKQYMAYHSLGLLSFYEFRNPDQAKVCFERALAIDSELPVDNYMLGEIAMGKGDPLSAVQHYQREVALYTSGLSSKAYFLADPASLRLAATLSSLQLSMLYSTSAHNAQLAQNYFNLYLKLETDQQRRQNSINQIQKYWSINNKGAAAP